MDFSRKWRVALYNPLDRPLTCAEARPGFDEVGGAVRGKEDVAMDRIRRDIAISSRILVDLRILEYSGHLSSRLPSGDQFLIQPVNDVRSDLDPSRLLVVGLDGEVIKGDGRPPSETPIHSEIYKARPDVGAVAHFHHDRTTMFSMVKDRRLEPVKNHAGRWMDGIPVHRDASHIASLEQAQELVQTLGACNAALLRGHGEVILAENVKALFVDAVHFVENAEALAHALLLGELDPLVGAEIEKFQLNFDRESHAAKLWTYYTVTAANKGLIPFDWLEDRPT